MIYIIFSALLISFFLVLIRKWEINPHVSIPWAVLMTVIGVSFLFVSDKILTDTRLGTYFTEILNSDFYMEKTKQELNKYTKLFFDGWHKGVTEFWDEIKEKL